MSEEERLKEKRRLELQLKREEEARKREIVVESIFDLTSKYEHYDISVNFFENMVTLRKPLEVKYLAQFRYECNSLGFKCKIGTRNDIYE